MGPFLELFGLTGLVVAQPVLAIFGDGPDIFVATAARPRDIVLFVLILLLAPPLALLLLEVAARLIGHRWQRRLHIGLVFVLLTLLAIQVAKGSTDLRWKQLSVLAAVVGLALAVVAWRFEIARTFLRFLAAAPVAMAVLFLAASPVSGLLDGGGDVAATAVEVGAPAPVLWIVLDELPTASLLDSRNRVDAELFPNFARLAGDATWYRDHTTVATHTPRAVPAILSGRYPEDRDVLPIAEEYPQNLFTLLADSYDLNVTESSTGLCPPDACPDSARARGAALPLLLEEAGVLWSERAAPKRRREGLPGLDRAFRYRYAQYRDFFATLDGPLGDRPRLDYLHLLLPHYTFERLPSGKSYDGPGELRTFFGNVFDDATGSAYRQRHLLQLAYTDRLLGDILDTIEDEGRYDESLIVVTADHGIGFSSGSPPRDPAAANAHEIAWTPLFVKSPGQEQGVLDERPMRTIDILPTVAEELGFDLPEPVDGEAGGGGGEGDEVRLQTNARSPLETDDRGYARFDRSDGYRRVLAERPAARTDDDLALYRLGSFGALVGREVDELEVGDPIEVDGYLNDEEGYEEVDLDDRTLPAWVSGGLRIDTPEPLRVGVAVNGVVAGWANAYISGYLNAGLRAPDDEQLRRWGMVIPPELLRNGENQVDVYLLGDEPDDELRPMELDGD